MNASGTRDGNSFSSDGRISRPRNRVLAALPAATWLRLAPHITHALLFQDHPLYPAGKSVEHVYFPNSGLISVMAATKEGASVEAGLIGREGAVGLLEALMGEVVLYRPVVQIDGTACLLPQDVFRAEFQRGREFHEWVLRYLQWMNAQNAQNALCNCLHSVEERLARWLLTAHDRIASNEIAMTHQVIAQQLGTRRSSISVAASTFEQQGLLHCGRGRVVIVDAEKLSNHACECYAALRATALKARSSFLSS